MSDILQPGRWGDYEIVRLVGRGGQAEVYEARDRAGQRRAIKVLTTEPGLAGKVQARFAQEGYAVSKVDHPNVVRYYGSGVYEDRLYLSLEFVDGRSLRQKIDRLKGIVPVEDVVRWIRDACRGMAEAHRHGIIHRDLKPSNILVTDSDGVKVIDFGVAKLRESGIRTTSEQRLGTTLYMAPELIQHAPPEERTDIYAMGATLYHALTGVHPMGRTPKNLAEVILWLVHERPRALREIAPEVSPSLEDLVHRALARNPNDRPQTMLLFAAALDDELRHERAPLRKLALNAVPSSDFTLAPTVALPVSAPVTAAPPPGLGFAVSSGRERDTVLPSSPSRERDNLGSRALPSAAVARGGTAVMGVAEPTATHAQTPYAQGAPSLVARTEALPAADESPPELTSHIRRRVTPPEPIAATLPLDDAERRSTATPVASTVTRPRGGSRVWPILALAAAGLVAVGVTLSWVFGYGGVDLAGQPAPASPPSSASPMPSSSAPAPRTARPRVPKAPHRAPRVE